MTDTQDWFAHATTDIAESAKIGAKTRIWHQSQVMAEAQIGERCNIGKCCYIDSGVQIGAGVKIQNGVSVYRGVTVEDDCFLGPHMVFTNDFYPRAFTEEFSVTPTFVKRGASIGANATIVCGNTLGEYCMVGSGSVVTRDVPPHALVVGNPARQIGWVCRCGAKLPADQDPTVAPVSCGHCGEVLDLTD